MTRTLIESNNIVLVHPYLNLYGLDVYDFRVLAHIARRSQKTACTASLEKMAAICRVGPRKVQKTIDFLSRQRLVVKKRQFNKPSICGVVHDFSEWAEPDNDWEDLQLGEILQKDRQVALQNWQHKSSIYAGISEVKPIKILFVHGYLDLYGLDPYCFRLVAHVACTGICSENLRRIAAICKMSSRKAQDTLKYLCKLNILSEKRQSGGATQYWLNPIAEWREPTHNWENPRRIAREGNKAISIFGVEGDEATVEESKEQQAEEILKEFEKVKAAMLSVDSSPQDEGDEENCLQ